MSTDNEVLRLNESRLKIWERSKEILDRAARERRGLSAEEQENYDRASDDLVRLDRARDALIASDAAVRDSNEVNEELRKVTTPADFVHQRADQQNVLNNFFRREVGSPGINALTFDLSRAARAVEAYRAGARGEEFRAIVSDGGASGGSVTVPTVVSTDVYSYLTAETPVRRTNVQIITRPNGDVFQLPKVTTHGQATLVSSQTTTIGGSDPVLGTTSLTFYKAAQLVQVSHDLMSDAAVDILSFVSQNVARAVGQLTDTWYVVGTGSSQPQGFVSGVSGSGTIATGGSLIDATAEKMVDLEFSIVDSYRQNASWFVADSAMKSLRKLRDNATAGGTSGAFLYNPSLTHGLIDRPADLYAGYPIYSDANISALGSNSVSYWFGDLSRNYVIADAVGFRFERSDDLAFDKDLVSFRGILRTAGAIQDSAAANVMKRSV